jgi:[acyl-carrier-protein] S-malonyltransferase
MKIAFCFPGQGSQDVGMGRAIAERFPEARAVYDEASEAVGYDVAQVCFEGPIEKLTRTDVQQPALVATSLACLRAVDTLGIKADFVVGHSVGEYSALAAAASLPDRDAIALDPERGRAMAEAAALASSAMAAVIGLEDLDRRGALCRDRERGAGELITAGPGRRSPARTRGGQAHRGGVRPGLRDAVKLRVGGAFHSPLGAEWRGRHSSSGARGRQLSNPVTPSCRR